MFKKIGILILTFISAPFIGISNTLDMQHAEIEKLATPDSVYILLVEAELLTDSIPQLAVKKALKAHSYANALNMLKQEAYSSYILGRAKLNLKKYYEARKHLQHAQVYFNELNNSEVGCFVIYNLALCDYYLNHTKRAIENFTKSAVLFKQLEQKQDYANCLQNLGLAHHSIHEHDTAKKCYLQALAIYKQLKDFKNIAGVYQNLGLLSSSMQNDAHCLYYYSKSIENFKLQQDLKGMGITYGNLGLFYIKKLDSKKSFENFKKSLLFFQKADFIVGQMWAYNNIGSSKVLDLNYVEAETYFNKSLEIAERQNDHEGLLTNYADLTNLYEHSGNHKKSLAYNRFYSTLKDSVHTSAASAKISRLDSLYFIENKEKQILQAKYDSKANNMRLWSLFSFIGVLLLMSLVVISAFYQKRSAEKNLTEHKNNLEKLVQTRTKELHKQIGERKIAEESDQLKSAFLANMSHELRTPMNAIIAFSNFLREPNLNEEKHDEYLDHISTAGDSLLRLIDDIIDIAKIESKQLKLFIQPTNLNRLLSELYKIFSELKLNDKGQIKFNLHMDDEFNYIINSDAQRLKQVLTNLLENAFKYTDKGNIDLCCETSERFVTFHVSDTGIGIPEDKQKIIFTRFHQLNHMNDRRVSGTGLGLAICKNLVNLLGGDIWVESKKNKGSKFSIRIPIESIKKQPNRRHGNVEKRTKIPKTNYNWKEITILVAEDEDLNFKVLDTCLNRTKAKIIRATDGATAVEICRNQKVDIVLMDIQMPGMDGYEATQEIKRLNNRTPVIAQTSFAMVGERERCLQAGCDDFITKPLNIDSLLSKIEHFMK